MFLTPPGQVKVTSCEPLRGTRGSMLLLAARAIPSASKSTATTVTLSALVMDSLRMVALNCEASDERYWLPTRSDGRSPALYHTGSAENEKSTRATTRLPTLMFGSINGMVCTGGILMTPLGSITSKFLLSNNWKEYATLRAPAPMFGFCTYATAV